MYYFKHKLMKNVMEPFIRTIAGLQCLNQFLSGCFLVIGRSVLNKSNRDATNRYMRDRSIKMFELLKSDVKVSGLENLPRDPHQPRIYMSNHLSLFDTPLFYATVPDTIRIVTKKELTRVPIIGKAILNSEHAIVDRQARGQNQAFYADAAKKLREGIALWFFPEGTRSRTGELKPFHMGGFHLAAHVGALIIPVGLVGTNNILKADDILPHRHQPVEIHIGEPVSAASYDSPELLIELKDKVHGDIAKLIA